MTWQEAIISNAQDAIESGGTATRGKRAVLRYDSSAIDELFTQALPAERHQQPQCPGLSVTFLIGTVRLSHALAVFRQCAPLLDQWAVRLHSLNLRAIGEDSRL
jgi:hypothetical protein